MTEQQSGPWLTPQERSAWLALYAVATRLPGTLDADLFRRARITLFDYHVLAMTSEAEGQQLAMSELASRSNASLSRLSHVVKKLEAARLDAPLPFPDRRPGDDGGTHGRGHGSAGRTRSRAC